MRAVWKVHFKQNGILFLLWGRSLTICWVGISFTASPASKVLVSGEQASEYRSAGGTRPHVSLAVGFLPEEVPGKGSAGPTPRGWRSQPCGATQLSREGQREGEVKCMLHFGDSFLILFLYILKIPWNSPWRGKHLLMVNMKLYYQQANDIGHVTKYRLQRHIS